MSLNTFRKRPFQLQSGPSTELLCKILSLWTVGLTKSRKHPQRLIIRFFVNLDERNLTIEEWPPLTKLQTHLAVPKDQREKPALEKMRLTFPNFPSPPACKIVKPCILCGIGPQSMQTTRGPPRLMPMMLPTWLVTLSWDPDPNGSTSFLQLGFAAWHAGVRLEAKDLTPACYATMIRKAFNIIAKKFPLTPAMPGDVSEKCKSDGKVHTSGYIKGGKIGMPFPANRMLGVAFVGRNHVLSNWKFLFNSISWSLCFSLLLTPSMRVSFLRCPWSAWLRASENASRLVWTTD